MPEVWVEVNGTRRSNRDQEADKDQDQGDLEVEVINDTAQPFRQRPLLSFEPLNPSNTNGANEYDEAQGLAENLPLTSTPWLQKNRNQTQTHSPTESQLNVFGIPVEFPLLDNSLEGERTNRSIYNLHQELAPYGYDLK